MIYQGYDNKSSGYVSTKTKTEVSAVTSDEIDATVIAKPSLITTCCAAKTFHRLGIAGCGEPKAIQEREDKAETRD